MAYKQKKWEAFSCPSGAFKSKKLEQAEKEMKKQKGLTYNQLLKQSGIKPAKKK